MKKSILHDMVAGYLFVNGGYDRPSQEQFRLRESARIAEKIRATWHGFDESSQAVCAHLIKIYMEKKPQTNGALPPHRKPAGWDAIAEARAFYERNARR